MPNIPIINIHTHQTSDADIELLNVKDYQPNPLISMGLHPWFLEESSIESQLKSLKINAKAPNVLAIGECGLDRNITTDLAKQIKVFEAQIAIAESVQKPLIIHCVKCFSELISIKKKHKPSVPMIVHGYNNNLEILAQLLKNDFYISLGGALLRTNANASKALDIIPNNRLFLETDDTNISISSIYKTAAEQKSVEVEELKLLIYKNFQHCFKSFGLTDI